MDMPRNTFKQALRETGIATIFTALTLSVGVATWSFSELKFQADMGLLLAFTFGMAGNRFDRRKELVVDDANAIGRSICGR